MRMLIDLLHDLGHRRLAYVSSPGVMGRPTEDRRLEFRKETGRRSLEHCGRAAIDGFDGGRAGVGELISSGFAPTAILCVNDWIAIGVLRELRSRGVSVPEDVSVTGFDNNSIAQFMSPSLTTVNVPRGRTSSSIQSWWCANPLRLPPGRLGNPRAGSSESTPDFTGWNGLKPVPTFCAILRAQLLIPLC
jgi:LacI family transcriptional regulator